jgi:hypothetical protein
MAFCHDDDYGRNGKHLKRCGGEWNLKNLTRNVLISVHSLTLLAAAMHQISNYRGIDCGMLVNLANMLKCNSKISNRTHYGINIMYHCPKGKGKEATAEKE